MWRHKSGLWFKIRSKWIKPTCSDMSWPSQPWSQTSPLSTITETPSSHPSTPGMATNTIFLHLSLSFWNIGANNRQMRGLPIIHKRWIGLHQTNFGHRLPRAFAGFHTPKIQSTLGFTTRGLAVNLALATGRAVTDLRQYINSDLVFSDLKFGPLCSEIATV